MLDLSAPACGPLATAARAFEVALLRHIAVPTIYLLQMVVGTLRFAHPTKHIAKT